MDARRWPGIEECLLTIHTLFKSSKSLEGVGIQCDDATM